MKPHSHLARRPAGNGARQIDRRSRPCLFRRLALTAAVLAWAATLAQEPTTWTINGPAMPIREFIAQVAEITGKTIVADQRVKNQEVTIFSSVPLQRDAVYELFLTVLKVNNFIASENEGVVTVAPAQTGRYNVKAVMDETEHPHDLMVTRVVPVKHVASTELVKTMRPLINNSFAHIAGIESPNVVIVADYAGNMRRILSIIEQIDMVDADEIVHRPLTHAWVGTVATVLEEIDPDTFGRGAKGPGRVQIVANERNNSLILKGKPRPIADVLRLIDALDVPETSTVGATVIHLNHADASEVAELLTNLVQDAGTESAQPVANIQADTSLNALIVRADPSTLNELLATISQLDVRRAQVLIEVAVVEVSVNDVDALGVELGGGDARGSSVPLVTTTLNGIIGGLLTRIGQTGENAANIDPVAVAAGLTSPTLAVAKLDRDGISFGAVITAMMSDTRANLLSTPSVLTLDNAEAEYFSGQQVPFIAGSFTTATDGSRNPFRTIQREQVGVTLNVTPHVHEDLSIRMAIELNVGNVVNSAETGPTFQDVVTAERKLTTTVLADDRQIILLGGLIQDDYRDIRRKVPLLGDIPVLGRAFRSQRKTLVKSHLLMFLRPTVLLSGEEAEATALRRYEGIYRLRDQPGASVSEDLNNMFEGKMLPEEESLENPENEQPPAAAP